MMKRIDYFIPTRIVFGAGRRKELATLSLPGKKALLCVTEDKLMEKLGIQQRVIELLGQNGVSVAVCSTKSPPTRPAPASWRPPRSPRKAAVTS
ncbi:MAG: hypothetical protein ACLSHC_18625 [Bilophila wadsworthia]